MSDTVYPIAGDTDTTTEDVTNCIFVELLTRARGVRYDDISKDDLDAITVGIWREVGDMYYDHTGRVLDGDRGPA